MLTDSAVVRCGRAHKHVVLLRGSGNQRPEGTGRAAGEVALVAQIRLVETEQVLRRLVRRPVLQVPAPGNMYR